MIPKISTCIICGGNETGLHEDISEIGKFADEIIVVNGFMQNNQMRPEQKVGSSFFSINDESRPAKALTDAVGKATGEWILIIRPGERVSRNQYRQLSNLCNKKDSQAYQFIVPTELKNGELSKYEWLGNFGKFSRADVVRSGYIPRTEVRFFKKDVFIQVLAVDDEVLQLALGERAGGAAICQIQIIRTETNVQHQNKQEADEQWQQDRKQLFRNDGNISEFTRSFELFGPGNIGYSLISETDIPSLEEGLDLGFGRIEILKWAVHNLIEESAYQEAIHFADKILDRLPEDAEIFEIWHLQGIAAFHLLDFEHAETSMQKALEYNATDMNTLSDLARVYIASGKLPEARMVLERVIMHHGLTPENEYIYNAVKRNDDRRPKTSLLLLCRDEAPYIDRALESSTLLFDEVVAVDTGSEDNTVDILREKGVKVVSYTWNDDFAEARNYGLAQVTGDYVFWMDADEYLSDKDRLSFLVFRHLLPMKDKIGVVFEVQTLNGDYDVSIKGIPPTMIVRRTALFPNSPEVRFSGKVFESVDACLERLNIPLLFGQSVSIKHHSHNETVRTIRKISAMGKSLYDFDVEGLFQGIQFWLGLGNVKQAIQWFEHVIVKANGNVRYLKMICKLFDEFRHDGIIQSNPQVFRKLISHYGASYRVATFCADYLYGLGDYDGATVLLGRLTRWEDQQFIDEPELTDIRKNRLNFAMASLEQDDIQTADAMLTLLSGDGGKADAIRAISFYRAIRTGDLDVAISVLSQWIRERNIPISGTIESFTDFVRLIADLANVVAKYGSIDAATILTRSADYFASTIRKEM